MEESKMITQTYLCPSCWKKQEVSFARPEIIVKENHGCDYRYFNTTIAIVCKDCMEEMFQCDNSLADIIISLNKNGIAATRYCCEGHHVDEPDKHVHVYELYSHPYITFELEFYDNYRDIVDRIDLLSKSETYKDYIMFIYYYSDDENDKIIATAMANQNVERYGTGHALSFDEFMQYKKKFHEFLEDVVELLKPAESE